MSIATKTGDDGTTALRYNRRVPKTHPRIRAGGAVDELSAALGIAKALSSKETETHSILETIQKELLKLGATLSVSESDSSKHDKTHQSDLKEEALLQLETWIKTWESENTRCTGFILPGENSLSATLHWVRTVCRRAELEVIALQESKDNTPTLPQKYLNRLSDTLWLLAEKNT